MTPGRIADLQALVGIAPGTFSERLSAATADAQALYGQILPLFAATGLARDLQSAAASARLTSAGAARAIAELVTADLIALGADGQLMCVFPLSAGATLHSVLVNNGPTLNAMCAVDALGIPAMLRTAAVIVSTDPTTGLPIQVVVGADGTARAMPSGTVVVLARTGDGPIASACCSVINFYADSARAHAALDKPGVRGTVLSVAEAHALGTALFGDLPAR